MAKASELLRLSKEELVEQIDHGRIGSQDMEVKKIILNYKLQKCLIGATWLLAIITASTAVLALTFSPTNRGLLKLENEKFAYTLYEKMRSELGKCIERQREDDSFSEALKTITEYGPFCRMRIKLYFLEEIVMLKDMGKPIPLILRPRFKSEVEDCLKRFPSDSDCQIPEFEITHDGFTNL